MKTLRDFAVICTWVYTLMVSWFYYHSFWYLVLHFIFYPLVLIYFLLTGKLADGNWLLIPQSYFQ